MKDKFEKSSVLGKGVRPMAEYQRTDKLRRAIYFEIRRLNSTLHSNSLDSRYSATIEKFIDAMIPSKIGHDPGRLPIYAKRPIAPVSNKVLCVFYLVSCLVQAFWEYLQIESEDSLAKVENGLEILRHINEHYDNMHIVGDVKKGYILEL